MNKKTFVGIGLGVLLGVLVNLHFPYIYMRIDLTEDKGEVIQKMLFPWAMVTNKNTTVIVPLLKNKLGAATENRINNSVQNLEYAFADAFTKLTLGEKKRIAIIKRNQELEDLYITDFLINSVNFLLDDTGLINIRNKQVQIPLLDEEKIVKQKIKWQLINIGVPLLYILAIAYLFSLFRKRRFAK